MPEIIPDRIKQSSPDNKLSGQGLFDPVFSLRLLSSCLKVFKVYASMRVKFPLLVSILTLMLNSAATVLSEIKDSKCIVRISDLQLRSIP